MRVADYYRAIDPGVERLVGAWEHGSGVEIVDRERPNDGYWEVPIVEAPGHFHFFIQTGSHIVDEELNGILLRRGMRAAGTVRVSRPEDTIKGSGVGPSRCLQASLTAAGLETCALELGARGDGLELRDAEPRADFGIGFLAAAHEKGLALGFSGRELHFQILRQAILRRLIATRLNRTLATAPFEEALPPARVRRIVEYIEDNLSEALSLNELAGIAGTSRFHFARAFRNTVGVSPHVFVQQRRLQRAIELIAKSRSPLHQIAVICGFANGPHLSRTFKAHFGLNPSEAYSRFLH